jgi:hypothetical protein
MASQCDNPIPTHFLTPIDCLKIPALIAESYSMGNGKSKGGAVKLTREELDFLKKNTHFDEETIKVNKRRH